MSNILPKRAAVLFVGLQPETFARLSGEYQRRFTSMDSDFVFIPSYADTFQAAANMLMSLGDLDVVYIFNELAHQERTVWAGAGMLAGMLMSHPDKPLLKLAPELAYLQSFLEELGLTILYDDALEAGCRRRWRQQAREAAAA